MRRISLYSGVIVFLMGTARPAHSDDIFHQIGKAAGQVVSTAGNVVGDGVKAVGHAAGQVVSGAGQVVGGAVGAVSPDTGNQIKDGARRLGNNVEVATGAAGDAVSHVATEAGHQIEQNPVGVLIAVLYPPAAPFVLGAPTLAQLIVCPVVEHIKTKESCNVTGTLSSLSQSPVATLGEVDIDVAPLTTLFKCLGIEGWLDTGCQAGGSGRPVRAAQLSGDGFWTIDVALDKFAIQGQSGAAGRFIRLEVRPNRAAHSVADHHQFTHDDHVCFGGPVLIDKGKWLEVHPIADFGTCLETPTVVSGGSNPSENGPGGSTQPETNTAQPSGSIQTPKNTHLVKKGECLATIAEEYYGKQIWPRLYGANRKQIKNPDLIYPGQLLRVPPSVP